jgi:cellulose 1,4-beta-cellobiosidase
MNKILTTFGLDAFLVDFSADIKRISTAMTLLTLTLGTLACQHSSGNRRSVPDSQTSTVTIDEFVPKEQSKQWNSMRIAFTRVGADKPAINVLVERAEFKGTASKETQISVPFGTYKILLTYYQNGQDILFESCEEEQQKEHRILTKTYPVSIEVCPYGPLPSGGVKKPSTSPDNPAPSSNISGINPFEGRSFFVNPQYRESIESAALKVGDNELKNKMLKLKDVSTAIWIDTIAAISKMEPALQTARSEIKNQNKSVIVTFVIYNLPERDCAAYASAGELKASERGLERYKDDYITPIRKILQNYPEVPTALIIEPDSLPNLATNMGVPKCSNAANLYREASAYGIKNLALPHTALYLDAAHGGWLGWPENLTKMAKIFKEVLDLAGGPQLIRGFASNVANYSPLTKLNPDPNPEGYYQFNPSRDELTYVSNLKNQLEAIGINGKAFVIDTSRNGQAAARKEWGNWCNIKGAGIGKRPIVSPAAGIDAYLWIKPPGESDGISDSSQKRFDIKCTSVDSMLGAPEAGQWFTEHFKILIQNAQPPL